MNRIIVNGIIRAPKIKSTDMTISPLTSVSLEFQNILRKLGGDGGHVRS